MQYVARIYSIISRFIRMSQECRQDLLRRLTVLGIMLTFFGFLNSFLKKVTYSNKLSQMKAKSTSGNKIAHISIEMGSNEWTFRSPE